MFWNSKSLTCTCSTLTDCVNFGTHFTQHTLSEKIWDTYDYAILSPGPLMECNNAPYQHNICDNLRHITCVSTESLKMLFVTLWE